MSYPTKEDILNHDKITAEEDCQLLKEWKRDTWKKARLANTKAEQARAIEEVLHDFCLLYKKPVRVVTHKIKGPYYHREKKEIHLDIQNPSILTALHELAHHLFDADETIACVWSYQLFKEVFPIAITNLRWKGHVLKKK